MQKLKSYDLTQYKPSEIVIINDSFITFSNNEAILSLYDLTKNQIVNQFDYNIVLTSFDQYLITMDNRNISLWDYMQLKVIDTFPILRDYPRFAIMNSDYVVISDSGYIGCRYYKREEDQNTQKPHLKFNGQCLVNAKLDKNILYTITLDGYLMIKNLKPNYRLKSYKIADQLLYGFSLNKHYIFVVLLDKSIMVIDKKDPNIRRLFTAHKNFVKSVICHEHFIYSFENLLPNTIKEVLIWDLENLQVISHITCNEHIKRFVIKDDLLFVFNKKTSILDIYQHNNFKKVKLWEF